MADAHRNKPVPSPGPFDHTVIGAGQTDGIIFANASRAIAAYTSPEMHNPNAKGVRLYTNIAIGDGGAGTVTVKIQVRDPNSDTWADLTTANAAGATVGVTTAALTETAAQLRLLTVYPGLLYSIGTATTNTEINAHLGTSWRVVATVGTDEVEFSVGAEYLL